MSEIRTLKDGETQIAPRTVAKAVSTAEGKTVEAALGEAAAQITSMQKLKRNNIMGAYPVKSGQSIHAGDVVDVVGGEVGKTWRAEANAKSVFYNYATSNIAVKHLSEGVNVVIATRQASGGDCWLVDDKGATISSQYVKFVDGAASNFSLDRLSDTKFVVGYSIGTYLYARIGTVSGTTITFGTETIISYKSGTTTYHNALISFSETSFLAVYYRTGTGLAARMCTVSGTGITTGSEYVSVSGLAENLSATRLPDLNGNKRVCICFSDGGDGNKGKAVIATIKADNTVEFGAVATFSELGIAPYQTSCVTIGMDALVAYSVFDGSNYFIRMNLLKVNDNALYVKNFVPISGGTWAALSSFGDFALVSFDSNTIGKSAVVTRIADTLNVGIPYTFNAPSGSNPTVKYLSSVKISSQNMLLSYADAGNSNYGTTTILEVQGDQIAGSFTDTSSECIALQNATGGQQCEVIFDGVAELPGFTAGTEISSPGVYGYCPEDGRVWVRPEWDSGVVTGSYIGTGLSGASNPNTLTFPFNPRLVMIQMDPGNTASGKNGGLTVLQGCRTAQPWNNYGESRDANSVIWGEKTISWYTANASYQLNIAGMLYRYCAIGRG